MTIHHGGVAIELLPERAALVGKHLLAADLHLGKDRAFRKSGIAVPEGSSAATLERLSKLIAATNAERVCILGDLFHTPALAETETAEQFLRWLQGVAVEVRLILGNHDGVPSGLLSKLNWLREDSLEGLKLLHRPVSGDEAAVCGHIHPMVRLKGHGRESFRLPCFWVKNCCLVLPAFGGFTGGWDVEAGEGDRIWAIAAGRVVEVPKARVRSRVV